MRNYKTYYSPKSYYTTTEEKRRNAPRFSKSVSIQKIKESDTIEELNKTFKYSCQLCGQVWYDCDKDCPVKKAYKQREETLKFCEAKANAKISYPRKYEISPSGEAKRTLAYFIRRAETPEWQRANAQMLLKSLEARNYGDLEMVMNQIKGSRGRLPEGEYGDVLKAIRAVLKAAKEV